MREIDVRHLGRERVICCFEPEPGVLVDPGPESCVDTLRAALGDTPVRAILLTHIHFDHAGATGALLRDFPAAPVYVHERGARHLADPERLVASATRLYGEEGMRTLWGEVVPVPAGNLRVLGSEGEQDVLDGAFRAVYAPGHASHHVLYRHERSGTAFTGDVAGVRIGRDGFVVAPTPPPDIDLELWNRSLDRLSAWEPTALALTHFGLHTDVAAQIAAVRARLVEQAELASRTDLEGFVAAWSERIAAATDAATTAAYLQAAPPEHLFLGLDRALRQKPDSGSGPRG